MARSIRSAKLETRTGRLKLALRWKPYTARVAPGVRLAYRRNATAGRWCVICADGKGGNWMKAFANADDYETANGDTILDFWQAQDRARVLARGSSGSDTASDTNPVTVGEALEQYAGDLRTRGGDLGNVARVRVHLPNGLRQKPVALLTANELKRWRDGLQDKISAGSINRVANALRATLNLAANTDERILNRRAWEIGLRQSPMRLIAQRHSARQSDPSASSPRPTASGDEFGLLVEIAATTGARVGQIARLEDRTCSVTAPIRG